MVGHEIGRCVTNVVVVVYQVRDEILEERRALEAAVCIIVML